MLFKVAIDTIQRKVKEVLNLTRIPSEASSANIRNLLADLGLTEPYNRTQCLEIADRIIADVKASQSALTVADEGYTVVENEDNLEHSEIIRSEYSEETAIDTTINQTESPNEPYQPKDVFSKAAIVKSQADNLAIEITPPDCIQIASLIDDNHVTELDFLDAVCTQLKFLSQNKSEVEKSRLQNHLDDLEEMRYKNRQEMMQMIANTSTRLKSYDNLFMTEVERMTGITRDGKRLGK
jgi:hypothetical protein